MEAHPILLQKKYARIICQFAEEMNISWEVALEFFYHSITYTEMSHGISDMHCRSDAYLVGELVEQFFERK
ncbi:MAG: DUF3791 domain-containing protein [Eubacteriales bacterium]